MGLGRLPAVWLRSVNQPTATGKEGERAEAISVNHFGPEHFSPMEHTMENTSACNFRKVNPVASVVVPPSLASGLLWELKIDLGFKKKKKKKKKRPQGMTPKGQKPRGNP
eukprot:FR741048.1.p3 GENE.FR741048.1~~FR741048.1.p3  ORF type:complete len:110 (+),score=34.98 FR741048.1:680-1009(+)